MAKIGPPTILPGKPIPIDNMYNIQNSRWNTTFVDQFGNDVDAELSLNGTSGSYVLAGGGTGSLSSVTYDNTLNGAGSSQTFSFSFKGRWTLAGQSGTFAFENGSDQNSLVGSYTFDAGGGGTWNGTRIDAKTTLNGFLATPPED
jgi:hypothetical protein